MADQYLTPGEDINQEEGRRRSSGKGGETEKEEGNLERSSNNRRPAKVVHGIPTRRKKGEGAKACEKERNTREFWNEVQRTN